MVYRLSQEDLKRMHDPFVISAEAIHISEEGIIGKVHNLLSAPFNFLEKALSRLIFSRSSGYGMEVKMSSGVFYVFHENKLYQWADPKKVKEEGYLEKRIEEILNQFKDDIDKPVSKEMPYDPKLVTQEVKAKVGTKKEWSKLSDMVVDIEGFISLTPFRHISNLFRMSTGSTTKQVNGKILCVLIYYLIPEMRSGIKMDTGSMEDHDTTIDPPDSVENKNNIEEGSLEPLENKVTNDAISADLDGKVEDKMMELAESEATLNTKDAEINTALECIHSLEGIRESLLLVKENGGFTPASLEMYNIAVSYSYKRLGIEEATQSMESYDPYTGQQQVNIAIESITDKIKEIGKKVWEWIKKIIQSIKTYFKSLFDTETWVRRQAGKIKESLNSKKELEFKGSVKSEILNNRFRVDGKLEPLASLTKKIPAKVDSLKLNDLADKVLDGIKAIKDAADKVYKAKYTGEKLDKKQDQAIRAELAEARMTIIGNMASMYTKDDSLKELNPSRIDNLDGIKVSYYGSTTLPGEFKIVVKKVESVKKKAFFTKTELEGASFHYLSLLEKDKSEATPKDFDFAVKTKSEALEVVDNVLAVCDIWKRMDERFASTLDKADKIIAQAMTGFKFEGRSDAKDINNLNGSDIWAIGWLFKEFIDDYMKLAGRVNRHLTHVCGDAIKVVSMSIEGVVKVEKHTPIPNQPSIAS